MNIEALGVQFTCPNTPLKETWEVAGTIRIEWFCQSCEEWELLSVDLTCTVTDDQTDETTTITFTNLEDPLIPSGVFTAIIDLVDSATVANESSQITMATRCD